MRSCQSFAAPDRCLCEDVLLNLAFRWFCQLDLNVRFRISRPSQKNRHGRFRGSDLFRRAIEGAVLRSSDQVAASTLRLILGTKLSVKNCQDEGMTIGTSAHRRQLRKLSSCRKSVLDDRLNIRLRRRPRIGRGGSILMSLLRYGGGTIARHTDGS